MITAIMTKWLCTAILKAKIGVIGYKDIQIIGEDPVSTMQKYEEAIPL